MDGVEGLYIVHFGIPTFYGSGVIVLETERFFGGDSMYYYVGDYKVNGNAITGRGKVVLHTAIPNVPTIFGDVTGAFNVELNGVIGNDRIDGSMRRPDIPAINLPIVLSFRERLP
jgi:hypothetical protein